MGLKPFLCKLTPELMACLKQADLDRKGGPIGVGPLMESLLRNSPAVKRAQQKLGVEFQDRPPVGRQRKGS